MRSLVLLALFFAACNPKGNGNGEEDPDDPTADGKLTVDLGTALGLAEPLFVAIDAGGGWVPVPTGEDTAEVDVPRDADAYRAVTVCPGPWEGTHEVFWLDTTVDGTPRPQLGCGYEDASGLHATSGTATGTPDLLEVSLGGTADTFFPALGEQYELATPPGTYDLVAIPISGAAPAAIQAVAGVVTEASGELEPLDFAAGYEPEIHPCEITGVSPYYVAVYGITANDTAFAAGNDEFYLPPADSGVVTEHLAVQLSFETSAQFFYTADVGDLSVEGVADEPFEYDPFIDAQGVMTVQPAALDVVHFQTWLYGDSETRVLVTVVDGEERGAIDVGLLVGTDEIEGFPTEVLGEPSGDMAAWGIEFADTNATINEVRVSHFASWSRDPTPERLGRSRVGVLVDDGDVQEVPVGELLGPGGIRIVDGVLAE